MPAKHSLKIYTTNGFYHIYNRGIDKKEIFLESIDFRVFLNYLNLYLSPKEKTIKKLKEKIKDEELLSEKIKEVLRLNNFYHKIRLHCFVLMKNHFHLLIRQKDSYDIEDFMRSLTTKYVAYFNRKYKRVGPLFQGKYKAALITEEKYLIYLSAYIHRNPEEILLKTEPLISYPWSSYPFYVKNMKTDWLEKELILSYFKKVNGFSFSSYQGFVEGYKEVNEAEKYYRKLMLDLDY